MYWCVVRSQFFYWRKDLDLGVVFRYLEHSRKDTKTFLEIFEKSFSSKHEALSEYSNPILSFIFRNLNYFHSSSKIIVVQYKEHFFTGTDFEKKKSFGYPMGLFRTFFCNNNMIHAVFHLHLGHFASNFFKPYFRSRHFLCHDLPQCLQMLS